MLRKTTHAEDSDLSISEDEDFTPDWPGNCLPLGETAERKGGIQIQSQLEILRDSHEISYGTEATNSLKKGQAGFSSEDDVEVPFFEDNNVFTSSPVASVSDLNEDIISYNEKACLQKLGSQKPDEACTWSAINKEAEALSHLTENDRSSSMHLGFSYPKNSHKGQRGKHKPKLLFRFQSHREDTSSALGCKNEVNLSSRIFPPIEELKGVEKSTHENLMVKSMTEEGTIKQLGNCEVQTEPILGHGYTNRSMVDLLDSYQGGIGVPTETTEMMVDEGNTSPVSERKEDSEEPPEALDSGSSSGDEPHLPGNVCNLELILSSKQKTMTDKFEEFFGVVNANEDGLDIASNGIGVFGKLQQVMQSEKKREMEFSKRMQTGGNSKDETSYFDVEILSRSLEAKLIVCHCSLSQEEHSQKAGNSQATNLYQSRTMTVICNPRVCDDVELEVGKLIRIYSPWREVQAGDRDEIIILSTFFSQI